MGVAFYNNCIASWVQDFLADNNAGLQKLVQYMKFRYDLEKKR